MSTPVNNLPLKTQQPNEDVSDISDPMVQDVLNEFQSEMMMSQKAENIQVQPQIQTQSPQQYQQQQVYQQPPQLAQQTYQQAVPIATQAYHPPAQNQYQQPQNHQHMIKKKGDFPYSLIDTEILQKTVIIILTIVLIYNTGLLAMMYEKLPDSVYELCDKFDTYIKIILIFIIIYALFILSYI